MSKPAWQILEEQEGCQFCGRRLPSLDNFGLTFAHIVADIPSGEPSKVKENGFLLCHSCHDTFDLVMKPKIQEARVWYLASPGRSDTDFLDNLRK